MSGHTVQSSLHPAHGFAAKPSRPSPPRHALRRLWLMALVAALGLAIGALLLFGRPRSILPPNADDLVAEMQAAANGNGPAAHVFGGRLSVDQRGDTVVVVAERVPPRACLPAGWALAQKGTVTVNGLFAAHLSAAKLVEMCNHAAEGAKITWTTTR